MNFFRGDAHKIYIHLKKNRNAIRQSKYLKELHEVREFYESLESDVLQLIYYRLVKEQNGSGMIPIFVSSIPFLFLIFSQQLQKILLQEGSRNWLIFVVFYIVGITAALIFHFRERAWASSHVEMIKDILEERKTCSSKKLQH
ncbi:hypothetical protein [Ureibacillus thermophilus]|uniref:Uncharacterized protein n=2 Tax=Ureibacillus thermophilus TaxID=367743 RepID=A0A4P6UPY2_9BACL|nr:hypothetical protein [Ureibacillus thermophilus]QBK25093.1 hypothetical protein DKZ56_04020 [Ureibacillus thermophilus]